MKLNGDNTRAQLSIQTELDAAGVELLIRQLAMLRSKMEPGVPSYPSANTPTLSHDGPALLMDKPQPDGSVTIRLCSPGLGWTSWRLPAVDVNTLRIGLENLLNQSTGAIPAGHKH